MENMDELNELLDFIKDAGKVHAYNLSYNVLKTSKESALDARVPFEDKIKALDVLIEFFTDTEEYEKCAYLHSLKLEIIEKENGHSHT
jgi:hypothetical protein